MKEQTVNKEPVNDGEEEVENLKARESFLPDIFVSQPMEVITEEKHPVMVEDIKSDETLSPGRDI